MEIKPGHYILAAVLLFFFGGTLCLVLDSLLNSNKNYMPPELDPEDLNTTKNTKSYTVKFDDDSFDIL